MELQIKATARDILDAGLWGEYCEATGTNEWALNEGLIDSDEYLSLPTAIARKVVILKESMGI